MYSEKHCLQNASMVTFQETTASHKVIYFTKKINKVTQRLLMLKVTQRERCTPTARLLLI